MSLYLLILSCCVTPTQLANMPGILVETAQQCREWTGQNPKLRVEQCLGPSVMFESPLIGQPAVDDIAAGYQASGWTVTTGLYGTEMRRGKATITCSVDVEEVPSTVRTRVFCFRSE